MHAPRLYVVLVGDGWERKLHAIIFCVIKLGRLQREGSILEIIWLIEGKPHIYFMDEGRLSNCELMSPEFLLAIDFLGRSFHLNREF